ncbi:sigma 54-interacting transcriptional regulator [Tissierellaceae bacterium BX21]|jgi:arginine utilization regulatory protein|uniref:Sigma 54-interacting transcriptional regulator n=2 Tax=Paratissierella segnis TaxID=2763679 RepID=A0A926EY70_9FIRM|nr:sigma 54-interacting transcriptional regulator [Paratissierella segnis]
MDNLEEGIHIIDHTGKIVYYNNSAEQIDGIDKEKAIGKHLLAIYPSLTDETSTLMTVMDTGISIYKKEQNFINYKGEKISTINTSIPLKNEDKILGAVEISKDITNVREMSEKIVDLQSKLYSGKNKKHTSRSNEYAKFNFRDIVSENKEMIRLKALARRAAEGDASILIYGDTGTGKELFVHSIHNGSKRRHNPFITQNCAALPASLLEGILFGTAKGGFTGAEDRQGLFELADGGTLFLDEINSMPLELQSKLLRVLQDGNIRRVGDTKTVDVDVRIITATNIPPEIAIEHKLLRKDLYYRLSVVNFEIPPLRDRVDDIPILADYFINKFNVKLNKNIEGISDDVLKLFENYPWEGNVRELENTIEGIMHIYDISTIEVEHIPTKIIKNQIKRTNIKENSLNKILEETERNLILEALKETGNNITHAAELLQIPRQTLQYRILKHKL